MDATISVLTDEVHLAGSDTGSSVRLVNDENAPAFKAIRTDLLYPYRQKELLARVRSLLGGTGVMGHDVLCVRKVYNVDSQPNYFYKPQFSSPQYSEAFAMWLVDQYRSDPQFFEKARETFKNRATS